MLTNTYDISLCDYLRRHLSTGDVVLDAGANIGYISAMAGSLVGQNGEVHGFEPLQECFARLQVLARLNPQFRFVFNNCALGEEEGVLPISIPDGDARNATLVSGKGYSERRQVAVKRLDNYILEKIEAPERIKLIKVDVQGFELPVLRGLKRFFQSTGLRPLIACDMKPWELPYLGWTLEDFESYMRDFGYSAWNIVRDSVPIPLRRVKGWQAVVFKVI
jgi:FkbM family methyltransferase